MHEEGEDDVEELEEEREVHDEDTYYVEEGEEDKERDVHK